MQLFELENNEPSRLQSLSSWAWNQVSERIAKDWIFLTICGIIMALIAFGMDEGIRLLVEGKQSLFTFCRTSLIRFCCQLVSGCMKELLPIHLHGISPGLLCQLYWLSSQHTLCIIWRHKLQVTFPADN